MLNHCRKALLVLAALVTGLSPQSARADNWATAFLHTSAPADQVFRQAAILGDGTKLAFRDTGRIESADIHAGTIQIAIIASGQKRGGIYISIRTNGTGTDVEVVAWDVSGSLYSPAKFARKVGETLQKSFPGLKYEVKNGVVPNDFAFGISQVSLPSTAPVALQAMLEHCSTVPANSTQYPLQQIADTLSRRSETPPPTVNVRQTVVVEQNNNYPLNQQQQLGQSEMQLGLTLMSIGSEMQARAAVEEQRANQAIASHAINLFQSDANLTMNRFMTTTGDKESSQFGATAQAVNKARDDAYATLKNAVQRGMFNQVTNDAINSFGKQMADHVSQSCTDSSNPEEQRVRNLHLALDAWYANGKDWQKISPNVWNSLTERDKGRLRDGIDPEIR
ncbi:MAG TPA: hypothetical protein VIJ79_05750 [Acidobacteriaceae bacterium]